MTWNIYTSISTLPFIVANSKRSTEDQDCCVGELGSSINHKTGFENANACQEAQTPQRLFLLFESLKFIHALWKNVMIQYRILCHSHLEYLYAHHAQIKMASLGEIHHIDIAT